MGTARSSPALSAVLRPAISAHDFRYVRRPDSSHAMSVTWSVGKRPGNPFLPGSVVLSPVNSGLWAFSGEVSYERAGAGLA